MEPVLGDKDVEEMGETVQVHRSWLMAKGEPLHRHTFAASPVCYGARGRIGGRTPKLNEKQIAR